MEQSNKPGSPNSNVTRPFQIQAEIDEMQVILNGFKANCDVLEFVGDGSMCNGVFTVQDRDTGKIDAIKRVPKKHIRKENDEKDEKGAVDKTLQEIITLSRLSELKTNPSIIKYYGHFNTDASVLIRMEYFNGQQLNRYVASAANKPLLKSEKYRSIMDSLLSALHHAHINGVVHLDVKPDNILVRDFGELELRLIDFGLSRKEDAVGSSSSSVGGALGYRAPECPIDEPDRKTIRKTDRKMDIFSTGVMMYELFSNDLRDEHSSLSNYLSAKRAGNGQKLNAGAIAEYLNGALYKSASLPGGKGGEIDQIIKKCIAYDDVKKAELRYKTAEAVRIDVNLAFKPEAVKAVYDSVAGATNPVGALAFLKNYNDALVACNAGNSLEYISDSIVLGKAHGEFKKCREQVAKAICGSVYDRLPGSPEARQNAVNKCIGKINNTADQKVAEAYFAECMKQAKPAVDTQAAIAQLNSWKDFFNKLPSDVLAKTLWDVV
jgi:serine/threonine protein kinase